MEIELIAAIAILLVLVFLATVDMSFSYLSDVSLRRLAADAETEDRKHSADLLRAILKNRPRFRFALSSAILTLVVSSTVLISAVVFKLIGDGPMTLVYALVIGLTTTVVLRQILPRIMIRTNAERKLLFLLPAIRPLYSAVAIFSKVSPQGTNGSGNETELDITAITDAIDDRTEDAADDFQALMEVGEAEGIIEEHDRELIETMVEFSDTRTGEIMTPRTEICGLPVESTARDARERIIAEKYSRLPVYRDNIDNIVGMLYVRDLLNAWAEGNEDRPVEEIVREAYFVPETIPASELLKRMQIDHVQIAVVIDEYGGVAGLVTVEDILEEIVGEIEDEDIEEEEIVEIIEGTDGYWDVIGSTEIDKIERLFGLDLEDDDYTTIAGLVVTESGYVPKIGERLTLKGLAIEVINADEKKLLMLRLRPESNIDADAADASNND